MYILRLSLILLAILVVFNNNKLQAQNNISCTRAEQVVDPTNYCSGLGEFSNTNAGIIPGEQSYGVDRCWSGRDEDIHDMWFRFTAAAKAVNVLVNGTANGGTLVQPQVSLYNDNGCFNNATQPIACERDDLSDGAINLFQGGLVIGASYLIRVDGSDGGVGSYQMCINNFNPPVEPGQDFSSSSILCDKTTFTVQTVSGGGVDSDEGAGTCLGGLLGDSENQSTWFSWTAANSGSLSFTISPLLEDDIDWVLFELPDGIDRGDTRMQIRCSVAYGGSDPGITSCGSLTGMNDTSTDVEETGGCDDGQDGFVRSIDMIEGNSYALLVNNWDESGAGFEIEFGGTGEFLGPEPEFVPNVNLDILECDTEVTFTDASDFNLGNIVSWEWNFGQGATPQFAVGGDPKTVIYESVGDKIAALTVESDKGCLVTYTLPFTIQTCCEEFSDLSLDLTPKSLLCANISTGSIMAMGVGGSPDYQYSFDSINYNFNSNFIDLAADSYKVWVRDIKGCVVSAEVEVEEPVELTVDAGVDMETELGVPVEINASYDPPEYNVMLEWSPPEGITCIDTDCFDISVIAPGTTTYTLTATNEAGCIAQDQVVVTTIANYNVYKPNSIIVNTTGDTENSIFRLFAGPSADVVEELIVFDRWGNRVYRETGLSLSESGSDIEKGWDGRFRGQVVDSGIYSWIARVRFVDNTVETLKGDIKVFH